MKQFHFFITVPEGGKLPLGYGLAYYNFITREAITCPIPFNFVVGIARRIWLHLQYGLVPNRLEREITLKCMSAWKQGMEEGLVRAKKLHNSHHA